MALPGKKHSAILQSVTTTQDADGKNVVATATVATFDATFHPVSARESLLFNKETTVVTHKLRVDYDTIGATTAASLTTANQMVIDGKTYDITGVVRWDTSPSDHYRVNLRETDVDN